ncbi:MAG: tyrosine-type recombinase/integrase [Candidatus Limnocylindrales bacterium]
MKKATCVRVTGPLEPYVTGFRQELARQGYAPSTATAHLQLMAHVSRWLAAAQLGPADLSAARVELFLRERRASGQVRRLTPRGLIPLLGYLRELGVVPEPATPVPDGPLDRLVAEFAGYLAAERGLSEPTIRWNRHVAELFLSAHRDTLRVDGSGLRGLTAAEVTPFLLSQCSSRGAGSLNNVATALRTLLRFCYVQGHTATPLAGAVHAGPGWRDGGISRALQAGEVARLLASCDRRSAAGRRDFAILTVLARLGLRAREVAALSLDDVDWRGGALVVAGKGNRHDQLPVPVDVGRALADYCRRGRRSGRCRTLFLQVRAPYAALSPSAVSHVVVRACGRAGLPPAGAHRLRHSAATAMRRAGAPLLEIGQILRHRHTVTTAVYAKDDLDALATVARRWPGGAA